MKKSELRNIIKEELSKLNEGRVNIGKGYLSLKDDRENEAVLFNWHTGPGQSGRYTQTHLPKYEIRNTK